VKTLRKASEVKVDEWDNAVDAYLASVPKETPPPERAKAEQILVHCPIYPLEIAHRKVKRKSYRN
jgi:hypothetical protein